MALSLLVQMFAVVSPPEPTLAESNNDIIRGGFSSREQAVNYCRTNTQDFANILSYFKISCDALEKSTVKTIKSTDHSKQLHSMGRTAQGSIIAKTGKPTNEYSVPVNSKRYYMRNLWAWDSGSHSKYKILETTNNDGEKIMVLFTCGNIVTTGKYTPPKPPEKPKKPKKEEPPKDVCINVAGVQTTEEQCDVCPNVPGIQTNPDECYPCPEAEDDETTTACLELNKTASNQTQNLDNANGTLALAGDTIVYRLSAKNTGAQAVRGFMMDEDLTDVLEYAEIVDLDGGEIDDTNLVTWTQEDIAAGETLQKSITVKVKTPVPQTPASASDPTSYDLVMNNVFYGNAINIELPTGVAKTTEVLVKTLPSTGPGTTVIIGFTVTAGAAYFFARTRLMAKELAVVRTDFTSTGGI